MDKHLLVTTQESSEINPKAVFLGEKEDIINPIAMYLAKLNVDLYTGNKIEDAYFGDYFFYVGQVQKVKNIIDKADRTLPKTLLLLDECSDETWINELQKKHRNIKLVNLNFKNSLAEDEVKNIIDFFLGKSTNRLELINKEPIKRPKPPMPKEDHQDNLNNKTKQSQKTVNTNSKTEEEKEKQKHTQEDKINNKEDNKTPMVEKTISNLFGKNIPPQNTKNKKSKLSNKIKTAFIIIFLLIFIPIITLVIEVIVAAFCFLQINESLNKNVNLDNQIWLADRSLYLSSINLKYFYPLFTIAYQKDIYYQIERTINIGNKVVSASKYLLSAQSKGQELLHTLLENKPNDSSKQIITTIKNNISLGDNELALVEAELKTDATNPLLQKFNLNTKLIETRQKLLLTRQILSMLPETIGLNGAKNYLII
jgi:hypothetical protein